MSQLDKTITEVQSYARRFNSVLVSFSGGKDSLIVLDLCKKHFKKVVCFFMYAIPDLQFINEQLEVSAKKYDVEILQYPHWAMFRWLKDMIYCDQYPFAEDLPEVHLKDIYAQVRSDTGIQLIATGFKKSDSMWRRRTTKRTTKVYSGSAFMTPIIEWNKFEVLAYLRINKIDPPPVMSGRTISGVDLTTPSIPMIHDNYPEDFKKLLKIFPYAEAVVKRREFYGEDFHTKRASTNTKAT